MLQNRWLGVGVVGLALGWVPTGTAVPGAEDLEVLVMRETLVLPRVGRYGRRPIHVDPIQAAVARGVWSPPRAGDECAAADGSSATWQPATTDDDGWLTHDALRGGYVLWSVDVPEDGVMVLEATGHSSVLVNGVPRAGDPYRYGWVGLPVTVEAGVNRLLFHCSRGRLRARLVPPPKEAYFETREATLPDLIVGEPWPVQAGIVVVNAGHDPLGDLVISAGGSGLPSRDTPVPRIEPRTIRKIPFWLGGPLPPETRSCPVRVELVQLEEGVRRVVDTVQVPVRVRRPDERHKRTFVSDIDGSVQYYAVTPMQPPPAAAGGPRPALVLTLHGAAVEGSRQAAVYASKSWAHVVAPTNRRPFGFDWEDWGRLDAREVLDLAGRRYGTDPARTYLTGHSMGGHGTWHLGVTFPDRFAAIGPSAGWVSFASYAGVKRPESPTAIEQMLGRASAPSDTLSLVRNLLQHGVYVLHGAQDDNVPVSEARFMKEQLASVHPDFAYHEEDGAGHWWGDRCCDWPPMFEFFAARTRPGPAEVDVIEFRTASPGVSAWSHWVGIEQQREMMKVSSVEARLDRVERRFTITTGNVARLAVKVDHLEPGGPVSIDIDGETLPDVAWPENGDTVWAVLTDEGWRLEEQPLPPAEKGPHRYGPFKEAFRHRVMFVHGTQGTPEENAWTRAKARYDAETFWYRGNASVDVIADTDFRADATRDRSVILYGNADVNAAWATLLAGSPVHIGRDRVRIGDRALQASDLGCLLVRPRPDSDRALVGVVGGSGLAGMRLTDRLPYFVSGVAYPDCVVLGPETLIEGASGVRAAGYFGLDWSVERGEFVWQAAGEAN